MLTHCPSCKQPLPLPPEQVSRLEQALAQLAAGKLLTLKCPHCRSAIHVDRTGQPPQQQGNRIAPPPPPELDWVHMALLNTNDQAEDVPMALVLYQEGPQRETVLQALETVGYQVFKAETVAEALERMRFVNFACIVFQEQFEGSLEASMFHNHMCLLPMDRRRYVFYILIGDKVRTLYYLEALALSANLTVNTKDLGHLDLVLRRAIPFYEELFGPLLEELNVFGKR